MGISSETKRFSSAITQEQLLELIHELNEDDDVDGILVQLPLPNHINERIICDAVCCNKDVDGFNEKNVGRLCLDINTLIPCTALGVQELIKRSNIDTFGKNCVVVGRSKNVGLPIFMLMHADGRNETGAMDSTVTLCHRFTPPEQLKVFCQHADIIITATGIPGLIKADMVKKGACIIDVGITRVTIDGTEQTKLVGDVDFDGRFAKNFCHFSRYIKCPKVNCLYFLSALEFFRSAKSCRSYYTSSGRCWSNDSYNVDAKHICCSQKFDQITTITKWTFRTIVRC